MKRIAMGVFALLAVTCAYLYFNMQPAQHRDVLGRAPLTLGHSRSYCQMEEFSSDIARLLEAKNYERVEELGRDVLALKIQCVDGSRLAKSLRIALIEKYDPTSDEGWQDLEERVKIWEHERPGSIWARCARLEVIVEFVQWMRRNRFEADNEERRDPRTLAELRRAQQLFHEYAATGEQSYMLYSLGIKIGMLLGENRPYVTELFQKGRALDPTSSEVFQQMATYLSPRWYGEPGDAAQFLADELPPSGPNDLIYFWVVVNLERYYGNALEALQFSYNRIESGALYGKEKHEDPWYFDNWRALYAGYAKDAKKAKSILEQIGTNGLRAAWYTPSKLRGWRLWAGVDETTYSRERRQKIVRDYAGRPLLNLKASTSRMEGAELRTEGKSLLLERDYARLEEIGGILSSGHRLADGTSALQYFVDMFNDRKPSTENEWKKMEEVIASWEKSYPHSGLARAAHLDFLVEWAWWHRGGDWAYKVKPEAWSPFHDTLKRAQTLFEDYRKKGERNESIYSSALLIATGLNADPEYVKAVFEEAGAMKFDDHTVYSNYMFYLLPKWHGEKGDSEAFLNTLPDDNAHDLAYAQSVYETLYQFNHTIKNTQFSYARIRKGCEYGAATSKDPEFYLNFLAKCAVDAGDLATAKRALDKIGLVGNASVWRKTALFREARNAVGLE